MLMVEGTILLIDAYNLYIRHFVANPALNNNGAHVGGIVGFIGEMTSVVQRFKPKKVYIIWESGGSQKRRNIFPDYKSHRRPEKLNRIYADDVTSTVNEHNSQIEDIISLLKYLPVNQVYVPDCEADDIISYICKYEHPNETRVILSSDKDFYQLVTDKIIIHSPTSKKIIQVNDVIERCHVHPNNFALAKAVCGDPSDNIPGIPGVGYKSLSKRFQSLTEEKSAILDDFLFEAQEKSKTNKQKIFNDICANESIVRRNWRLVYLDMGMLSGDQIKKVQTICGNSKVSRDKIGFIRHLLRLGIVTMNSDFIFYTFNHIGA